jgi:8-oxo-dGTP pyrophosphatase MutT (NUDIX family)
MGSNLLMKYAMPEAFRSYKPGYMQVFGCICLDSCGNVLLVRGRGSSKWSFPKGHKRRQESSLACARRELMEETGIEAPISYSAYYKMKGGEYYVFHIDSDVELFINDTIEIDLIQWFPLNALPEINTNIDVSIFRSHLRRYYNSMTNVSSSSILDFIGTATSIRYINNIQGQIA